MGHLLRLRDLIQATSELTTLDIPPKRKGQVGGLIKRGERLQAELEAWAKLGGALGIAARMVSLNLADYIRVLKGARFVK